MESFRSAFDEVPDLRAVNALHDLGELLVIRFLAVLCESMSCTGMAAVGRARERILRDFLTL
jgi:hypothetical protein